MITETSGKAELVHAIEETITELQELMANIPEEKINTVPYAGSWTAGQLFRHVTKSINGMGPTLKQEAMPAERNPAERVAELRKTFLDFSTKMKSPDFIVPEDKVYEKNSTTKDLNDVFEKLQESAAPADLNGMLEGLPFGPVTKLELLHFVLYHTQRHLHQFKKISDALENK